MSGTPFAISRFSPGLAAHESLEGILVQRGPLLDRTMERLRSSVQTGATFHELFVGPRGIGKTFLVAVIYHRVKSDDELRARLRIAWMREDEWSIASLTDLLVRVLRALEREYPNEGIGARIEAIYADPERAEQLATSLLKEVCRGQQLLLLIENLDEVLYGLGDEGVMRWRAMLQNERTWNIVATTSSLTEDMADRKKPFFGFFRIEHLQALSLEEGTALLGRLATLRGDSELVDYLGMPEGRGRVRAVHALAGGNPRIYVIFSQFLNKPALDELVEAVMQTLDDLTPYYQARMQSLSPQQRKLVEILAEAGKRLSVNELSRRAFATSQSVSKQLHTLAQLGYVTKEDVGRESHYGMREQLMRLCLQVKAERATPVRLLVLFFRYWYTTQELQERLGRLNGEALTERSYVQAALDEATRSADPRLEACVQDYRDARLRNDDEVAHRIAEELRAINDPVVGNPESVLSKLGPAMPITERIQQLYHLFMACEPTAPLNPENPRDRVWVQSTALLIPLLRNNGQWREAEGPASDLAMASWAEGASWWAVLSDFDLQQVAQALVDAGEAGHAQTWLESLIAAAPRANRAGALSLLSGVLVQQKGAAAGHQSAMHSLEISRAQAAEIGTPQARRNLSISLDKVGDIERALGRSEGALRLYRESLEISRGLATEIGTPEARRDLSISLERVGDIEWALGRSEGATKLYSESLDIRRGLATEIGTPEARRDLSVSLDKLGGIERALGRSEGALKLFSECLEISRGLEGEIGTPEARRDLSISLDRVGDIERTLGRSEEALKLYSESLEIRRGLAVEIGTPEARRDLSISLDRVGDIERTLGRLEGALKFYSESLEIRRGLATEIGTPEARRDLSISLNKVGDIERTLGRSEEALKLYSESLEIRRGLTTDIGTPEARRDLSVSVERIADVRFALEGPLAARGAYWENLETRRKLLDNRLPESMLDLALALGRLAQAEAPSDDAARSIDEALVLLSRAEVLAPGLRQIENIRSWLTQMRRLGAEASKPSQSGGNVP